MRRYSKLLKNTSLVIIGNIGTRLISFIILPFYTYWLLAEEYGTVDLISTYVLLLSGIFSLGLPEALFRYPKGQKLEKQQRYVSSAFVLIAVSAIVILLLFFGIRQVWYIDNVFINYTYYIYGILILSTIQNCLLQLSRGIDKMSVYVLTGIIGSISNVSLAFLLVPSFHIEGCLITQIITIVITIIYLSISLRIGRFIKIGKFFFLYLNQLLGYSLPLIPNAIFWWLIDASNKLFLEKYNGLEAVGIFSLANKFPTMLQSLVSLFFISWQISCIEEYKSDSFRIFYNRVCRSVFMVSIALSIISVVVVNFFIVYVLSTNYAESTVYLPILFTSLAFSVMSSFFATNFTTYKQTKYLFYTTLIGAFVALIINWIFIPIYGVYAAAFSILLSQASVCIIRMVQSERFISLDDKKRYIASAIVLCIGTLSCTAYADALVTIVLFMVVTLVAILFINSDAIMGAMQTVILILKKKQTK